MGWGTSIIVATYFELVLIIVCETMIHEDYLSNSMYINITFNSPNRFHKQILSDDLSAQIIVYDILWPISIAIPFLISIVIK